MDRKQIRILVSGIIYNLKDEPDERIIDALTDWIADKFAGFENVILLRDSEIKSLRETLKNIP